MCPLKIASNRETLFSRQISWGLPCVFLEIRKQLGRQSSATHWGSHELGSNVCLQAFTSYSKSLAFAWLKGHWDQCPMGGYPICNPFATFVGITMKVAQVTSSRLPTSCGASPAQRTWAVNWTRLVRITTMSKTWSKSWIPLKHNCFRGNSNKLQVTSPPIFVPQIGLWTTILWLYYILEQGDHPKFPTKLSHPSDQKYQEHPPSFIYFQNPEQLWENLSRFVWNLGIHGYPKIWRLIIVFPKKNWWFSGPGSPHW